VSTTTAAEGGAGWGFPPVSRKAHYIAPDGRSLCGKLGFAFNLPLEPDNGRPSPDDCAACRKRLDRKVAHDGE
jgi:hypothetical protein